MSRVEADEAIKREKQKQLELKQKLKQRLIVEESKLREKLIEKRRQRIKQQLVNEGKQLTSVVITSLRSRRPHATKHKPSRRKLKSVFN